MASTPLRRLFHWGPIAVIGIISLITWAMIHHCGMYWPPHASVSGAVNSALFLALAAATLYFFLQSLLEGPGFVPLGWKPENEEEAVYLQYCTVCNGYKAPRSHHCKTCGHCVMKMDHHCPWINCCVGHRNHAYFNLFLVAGVIGCGQASAVLICSMYHAISRPPYTRGTPFVHVTLTTLLLSLLAIGMAVGVLLAMRGILRNRTTIEDWIMEKANGRREERGLPPFTFPYDLGRKRNLASVFLGDKEYDGLSWPVRDGCGKYDLTIEQKAQKAEKLQRSRLFTCTSDYSGRWFPVLTWWRAALAAPCQAEPRLPLHPGDTVRVTRQRRPLVPGLDVVARGAGGALPGRATVTAVCRGYSQGHTAKKVHQTTELCPSTFTDMIIRGQWDGKGRHWLFGEKLLLSGGDARGPRGWFPRAAVVPTDELGKRKPD
ncbi:hypothetical protein JYU34_006303 [Plutella xylostella]|uniref:Palmitoyltransferase n=1 Tax=Plutella xylostella TaxID=51655 RepID=A0ABQ7QRP5_PLUXY|nr:hypothetical protein JYU34_006303 [Plutella xylostella]